MAGYLNNYLSYDAVWVYNNCRYRMASYYATLQRAKKILAHHDDLEPRQYCVEPYRKSAEKSIRRSSSNEKSLKKSIASPSPRLKKDFSFCASKKSFSKIKMNSSTSSIKKK